MTKSVPLIAETPDLHCAVPRASNLVKLSRATRQERFYHRNDLPSKPSEPPPAVFRYLDCFMESCIRAVSLISDWMWRSSTDRALVKRETVEIYRVATLMRTAGRTFLKAVSISSQLDRITQTKQGGCLYEWPEVRINGYIDTYGSCAGCNPVPYGNEGSIPSISTNWQKPGIDVAVIKSSPIREADKEKEISTRLGYR